MSKTALSPLGLVAKGALMVMVAPRLARQDACIDLDPILAGITPENYPDRVSRIGVRLRNALRPHLAEDASLDDLDDFLSAIAEVREAAPRPLAQDGAPTRSTKGLAMPSPLVRRIAGRMLNEFGRPVIAADARIRRGARDDDPTNDDLIDRLVELLGQMDPDQVERALEMMRGLDEPEGGNGMDQPPPFPGRPTPGGTPLPLTMRETEQRAMTAAQDAAYRRRTAGLAADAAVRNFTAPARGRAPAPTARATAGFASRFPSAARIGRA